MNKVISTLTLALFAGAATTIALPVTDAEAHSVNKQRCAKFSLFKTNCEQNRRALKVYQPPTDTPILRIQNFRARDLSDVGNEKVGGGGGGEGGGGGGGGGGGNRSDIRLKRDIAEVGTLPNGLRLYRFKYLWSDTVWVGVMAQEVLKVAPQAVITGSDGFYSVRYDLLGTSMMTFEEWQARTAANHHPPLAA